MEIKNISEYIKADTIDLNLKAKNKNAVKLIIPSAKTAVTPAYSLTSAPAVIKISGEADIKIEAKKTLISLSPVLRLSE